MRTPFLLSLTTFAAISGAQAQSVTPGAGAGGTVTSVTAGTCMSGGAITTAGTVGLASPLATSCGGTGTATPANTAGAGITLSGTYGGQTIANSGSLTAGGNITLSGVAPNQTIAASGGLAVGGSANQVQFNSAGSALGGTTCITVGATTGAPCNIDESGTTTLAPVAGHLFLAGNAATVSFSGTNGVGGIVTSATLGLVQEGSGSTNDMTWINHNGSTICQDASGSTTFTCGTMNSTGSLSAVGGISAGSITTTGSMTISAAGQYLFTGRAMVTSPAGATVQLGAADAAAPVAQTLTAQSVATGTSNTAGVALTVNGSKGTGSGAGGALNIQTAGTGAAATTQNTEITALSLAGAVGSTPGAVTLPNLVSCTGIQSSAAGLLSCTASDARLKDDEGVITSTRALRKVLSLPNLHAYEFKAGQGPGGVHYGWFAQQVRVTLPELVRTGHPLPLAPDGVLQFDRSETVPLIAAALKAMQAEIDADRRALAALKRGRGAR